MTPRVLIEPARLAGSTVLRVQTDDRLVDLVRAGNDRAFEAIVDRYYRPLVRYCGRLLPPARAEDAVQQAFLNAFGALRQGDQRIELRPWLYRIAHNAALNALRENGWSHERIESALHRPGAETTHDAAERRASLRTVLAAVQDLPERQRDAMILRELEGRTYEQIAVELDASGGAVRQLLNRARHTLRAAVTALTPFGALTRLPWSPGAPVIERVTEAASHDGLRGGAARIGGAVVASVAVAAGLSEGPKHFPQAAREGRPASGAAAERTPSLLPRPAAGDLAAASAGGAPRLALLPPREATRLAPDPPRIPGQAVPAARPRVAPPAPSAPSSGGFVPRGGGFEPRSQPTPSSPPTAPPAVEPARPSHGDGGTHRHDPSSEEDARPARRPGRDDAQAQVARRGPADEERRAGDDRWDRDDARDRDDTRERAEGRDRADGRDRGRSRTREARDDDRGPSEPAADATQAAEPESSRSDAGAAPAERAPAAGPSASTGRERGRGRGRGRGRRGR